MVSIFHKEATGVKSHSSYHNEVNTLNNVE